MGLLKNKKFWNFKAKDKTTGELTLYGEISEYSWWGDEVTPKQFKDDLDSLGDIENLNVFINPKIINTSIEDVLSTEGCISIPTVGGVIYRQKEITIEYFDEHTNKVQKTFSNMLSKIIQHEMDHLNGILFINKMPENQRSLIASKLFSLRRHQKD